MNNGINRQARLACNSEWWSFGNVTLSAAAVRAVEVAGLSQDKVDVVVRDEHDQYEHKVTVECVKAYKINGLKRGAE